MTGNRQDVRQLAQIQRWLQTVITHPDGVEAGMASDAARSEIDISADRVEEVIDRSKRRTSVERLEIYANAYYARLLECLRDEYPALLHAAGDEVFDGLAFGYLQAYPSQSYTLGELSRRFAQYLEETRPTDEDEAGAGPSWPEFLIDLVRLERCYSDVFDGPGAERMSLLDAAALKDLSPEVWMQARLVTVPCLRLLSLRFPVHEYATAVREKQNPDLPEPTPTWLAVSRINYVVRRWTLSPVQFELLAALIDGQTVGTAIERAARLAVEAGDSVDRLADSLRDWFAEWSSAGFFRGIQHPLS
jgi:Putative DNA-binding domain